MSQFPINKQQHCTSKRNLFKTDKLSRFGIEHTNSDTMKKKNDTNLICHTKGDDAFNSSMSM